MTVIPGTPDPDPLTGSPDDDLITAYGGDDTVLAGNGNDLVYGGQGNDSIDGSFGNDLLYGEGQNDTLLAGGGIDQLFGGDGSDYLVLNDINYSGIGTGYGGDGNDMIASLGSGSGHADGGAGIDTLFLLAVDTSNLLVDFTAGVIDGAGTFDNTTYTSMERLWVNTYGGNDSIYGGDDADRLVVSTGDNVVLAQGGDDYVSYVTRGTSTLDGGAGRDVLVVSGGESSLYFIFDTSDGIIDDGQGSQISGFEDYIAYGGQHADIVVFDAGDDLFIGRAGSDTAGGSDGRDTLNGQNGADVLIGGAGNDRLYGGNQNDTLQGDAGRDFIAGGKGDDLVDGGEGDDRIKFGLGNDTATGGAGADRFLFITPQLGVATITDFETGVDQLRFTGAYLQFGPAPGHLDPQLLSYGAAAGAQAQFVLTYDGDTDTSSLTWDPNGEDPAGGSYIYAFFTGQVALAASDFLIL